MFTGYTLAFYVSVKAQRPLQHCRSSGNMAKAANAISAVCCVRALEILSLCGCKDDMLMHCLPYAIHMMFILCV